jgi:hypothetical protein
MGFVTPPCVIDFAKCYLDNEQLPFDAEQLLEHEQAQVELWEDKYPAVQSIAWQLRRLGIHYLDTKPANIMFLKST